MLFALEIIWGVASAIGIAVGVEPTKTWKKVFRGGGGGFIAESTRRILLFASLGMSGFAIFCAFYYLVRTNAIIVLFAWIFAFVLSRFAIEILQRREYVDETALAKAAPEPQKPSAPRLMYTESYRSTDAGKAAEPERKKADVPAPVPVQADESKPASAPLPPPAIPAPAAPAPEPLKVIEEYPVPEEEKGTSVEEAEKAAAPVPRIDLDKYPNLRPKPKGDVDLERKAPPLPPSLPVYTKKSPLPEFEASHPPVKEALAATAKGSAFKPEDFEGEPGTQGAFNTGTYNDIFKRLNGTDPDN